MNEAHTNKQTIDTSQCHSNSCERDYLEPENEMFNFKNDQDSGVDGIKIPNMKPQPRVIQFYESQFRPSL